MAFSGPPLMPNTPKDATGWLKPQQAHIIEGIKDLEYTLGWALDEKTGKPIQKQLFVDLTSDEQRIFDILKKMDGGQDSLDNLSLNAEIPVSMASILLLELEFKDVVKSLPGKTYRLV